MGMLTLAGALSGAGKGLETGLHDAQKANLQQSLEKSRQEMENLRQERLLSAQGAMHRETLASQKGLSEAQIAAQRGMHEETLTSQKGLSEAQIAAQKERSQEQITAQKGMHTETIGAQKSHDEVLKEIHKLDRTSNEILKRYEIDTSSKIANKTAAAKAITEIGSEITRLSVVIKDPLLDRASPEFKFLSDRMKRLESLHDVYSNALRPEGTPVAAMERPARPAFVDKTRPAVTPETPVSPPVTEAPGGFLGSLAESQRLPITILPRTSR